MKKILSGLWCILALCALATTVSSQPAAADVTIPDSGLDSAIRANLGLGPADPITESALAGITVLDASMHGIADLTGLEYCTSLRNLTMYDNQISDLTPLQELSSLGLLWLHVNQISDLTPLQGLTSLWSLSLSNNQISNLTPLQGLTSLWSLEIDYNQISNLTPLQGLTNLGTLSLTGNQISNLTPLQGLTNLTILMLDENRISNLSPLQGLTSLQNLWLRKNCISDLSPLLTLPALGSLFTDRNPLSDTAITVQIPQLTSDGVLVYFEFYSEEYCLPVAHPCDLNSNFRITISEAIPFLSGWQRGNNPMASAIRAAYLWQNGEYYSYDRTLSPPLCWVLATPGK